ncbi:MAG: family 20 glycosylhydrolase [Lachnospiraceae bacterium]|nr:family 20 glycosylhydrolase [Lachnospiraceae bacterium]
MYIIPEPQEMEFLEGTYTIRFDHKIVVDVSCGPEAYEYAKMLQEELRACMGYGPAVTKGRSGKTAVTLAVDAALGEEEYRLTAGVDGIGITGGANRGLLYGVQTLRQIVRQAGSCVPCMWIHDFPDIRNRGFYHDVTRGRIPTLSYLKGLADNLAFYKINQLQLYIEHSYLFEDLSEMWRDDTPLTAQDILELDSYCRKLQIELIPNISCFGHLYKLLRTKTYEHLCELPGTGGQPFGFVDRMMHHTIDVTNEESLTLIKGLIEEFMPLFTSKHFNIGADETFDLGKGRSLSEAERVGVKRLYIDHVRKLCEFLVEKGKIPMFWGDIVCDFPEVIRELPEQTICLNWGYDREQSDESTRKLAKAGAVQYSCPGVSGWNQFVNRLDVAYENIKRMCTYARQYHTEGVLTTDWGDYGHINHPDLGIPGRIYGAAFSWNGKIPSFEEMNRRISQVEFGDRSGELVSVMAKIADNQVFDWWKAVYYKERGVDALAEEALAATVDGMAGAETALQKLMDIEEQIRRMMAALPARTNEMLHACLVAVRGVELFQKVGAVIAAGVHHRETAVASDGVQLAAELEEWFMFYKEVWRSVSRESELYRIEEVVFWYADLLRGSV